MRIRVSKADVIQALVDEPIETFDWGNWARAVNEDGVEVCTACAVGIVVRDLIAKNNDAGDVTALCFNLCSQGHFTPHSLDSFEEEAEEALRNRDYMGAISLFYEGLCRKRYENEEDTSMNQIVSATVQFIEDNFPESMEIKYPDNLSIPLRRSAIVGGEP